MSDPANIGDMDNLGRVFGNVGLAHQTCLALELVLVQTLHDIRPMAASHVRVSSTNTDGDGDPQAMVIASLRNQVGDLLTQVTQLNGKLVQSYDRISDLEDNLHIASSAQRAATLQISGLELERTQHLAALNTGLLVEKAHVTSELTRLMEKATEEAAQRGIAESARQEIEKDLDDLSAELFARANGMVAEARLAQAQSERRVQEAEAGLRTAEEAVRAMQEQMQALREDKERADRVMDKGKWVERPMPLVERSMRLLSTHPPYTEFLLFVAHLRQLRLTSSQLPPIASLLPLPFLARLIIEDSDPTLRLDTAPALNWLTRRTVTTAIHSSQLTVEPLSVAALSVQYADPHSATCALCGKAVLPPSYSHSTQNTSVSTIMGGPSWRPSFLKNPSSNQSSPPPPPQNQTPHHIHSPTPSIATTASFYPPSTSTPPPTPPLNSTVLPTVSEGFISEPQTIYVFRLQPQSSSGTLHPSTPTQQAFSHPHSSTTIVQQHMRTASQTSQSPNSTFYPLCSTGWCLARLRTTCELWRFVRLGIVASVWEEEIPHLPSPPVNGNVNGTTNGSANAKPPVPPRRRGLNIGMGKLFGIASNALSKGTSSPSKNGAPPTLNKESKTGAALTPPPLPRRNETREKRREARENRERAASVADTASLPPAPIDTSVDPAKIPLPHSPIEMIFDHDEEHKTAERSADITNPAEPKEEIVVEKKPVVENDEASTDPGAATATPNTPAPASRTASPAVTETRAGSPAPPLPRRAPRRAAPVPPKHVGTGDEDAKPVETEEPKEPFPGTVTAPEDSKAVEQVKESSKEDRQELQKEQPIAVDASTEDPALPLPPTHPSRNMEVAGEITAGRRVPPSVYEKRSEEGRALSIRSSKTTWSDNSGQFVGEATWEERTWKHLARLRDDMFYARIGCVR